RRGSDYHALKGRIQGNGTVDERSTDGVAAEAVGDGLNAEQAARDVASLDERSHRKLKAGQVILEEQRKLPGVRPNTRQIGDAEYGVGCAVSGAPVKRADF